LKKLKKLDSEFVVHQAWDLAGPESLGGGHSNFKEFTRKGRWRIVGGDDCDRCPSVSEEYGCVTFCNLCVEGSFPGNFAYGYVTSENAGLADTAISVGGAIPLSTKPTWDQCAIGLGRVFGYRTKFQHEPFDRERLCKALDDRGCPIQTCPCDVCNSKGEYP
jgi:hypothetical protein